MSLEPVGPIFRSLSRLRGERIFHPRGVAYEATWTGEPGEHLRSGDPLVQEPRPAVVRFSRGIGLPPPVADILGIAIKVFDVHGPDGDQDLLLASVGNSDLATWLLTPRTRFEGSRFSTVLRYDVHGTRTAVLGSVHGEPITALRDPSPVEDVEVELVWSDGASLARLDVGGPLTAAEGEALRFDPWHTGASLRPAGVLNAVRRPAYEASQEGRDAPVGGIRHLSD